MKYKDWTLIDWDGNPELKLKCWRKSFDGGHVSVGVGDFLAVVFSFGANSERSYSSTRWDYDRPVISEADAMQTIDTYGRMMQRPPPHWGTPEYNQGKLSLEKR